MAASDSMSGIRVRKVPKTMQEKQLKIHFSKPNNGGGLVHKIYYPLFNNDAVILFDSQNVVDQVMKKPHSLHNQDVEVECLPEHMIFMSTEAELNSSASVLLLAYRQIREEMQFDKEIEVMETGDQGIVKLKGSWFQLEWAWHFIDCIMQQQELIHTGMQQQQIEEDSLRGSLHRSTSPSDINQAFRLSISERSAVERSARNSRSSEYSADHQGVDKLRQDGQTNRTRKGISTADKLEQKFQENGTYPGSIGGPEGTIDSLKHNIGSAYDNMPRHTWESDDDVPRGSHHQAGSRDRRAPSDGESSGDDLGLQGHPHKVPFESVHSTLGMENKERRADENQVFENFSGLMSLQRNQEQTKKTVSDTYDIRAEKLPQLENSTRRSPSSSLTSRQQLADAAGVRETASSPEDALISRYSKTLKEYNRSQRSPLTSPRDSPGDHTAAARPGDSLTSSIRSQRSLPPTPRDDVGISPQSTRARQSPDDMTATLTSHTRSSRSPAPKSPRTRLSPDHETAASLTRTIPDRSLKSHEDTNGLSAELLRLSGSPRSSQHGDSFSKYGTHGDWDGSQMHSMPASLSRVPAAGNIIHIPDRYSEDQLSTNFDISGVKVVVYYGDLTKEETEAIVNPANVDLDHTGGVAGALSRARGYEMQSESNNYIRKNGRMKVTDVTHTSGGGEIKATHIMHAAGPIWFEYRREECTRQIAETFLNCFKYANKMLWIRSIAVPAISTGVYGAPLDECVRAFLHAILMFAHTTQREGLRLREVRLVNNDAEATVTSIVLLQTLLEEGMDSLTRQAREVFQTLLEEGMDSPTRQAREVFQVHEAETAVEQEFNLNLPKGRPERSGSFTKTYSVTREQDSSPTSVISSTLSRSKRRSSSTSRVPDKKKYEKDVYGSKPESARSGRSSPLDHRSGSVNARGRERSRTSSFSSPVTSSRDRDVRGASETSSKTSSKTPTSSTRSSRAAPVIKQSLLSTGNLKVKSGAGSAVSSPGGKTSTTRMRTSDDKPAARPKTSRDTYERSTRSEFQTARYNRHYDNDDDEDSDVGLRSLPIDLGAAGRSSYRERFLQLNQTESKKKKADLCAICLDVCKQPKQLQKCQHTFCTDCIRKHFRTKPTCPVCNTVYGEIQGDQPRSGMMTYTIKRDTLLPGYEREDGAIVVTYTFPDGQQEACHPSPGRSYKGLSRKCYLPNSVEGREILRMLKKAFDQRLVFTIGQSRTTGAYGALTWNDIHHKTSVSGGPTKHGYPDPGFMKRVKEDLAAKGITSDR